MTTRANNNVLTPSGGDLYFSQGREQGLFNFRLPKIKSSVCEIIQEAPQFLFSAPKMEIIVFSGYFPRGALLAWLF